VSVPTSSNNSSSSSIGATATASASASALSPAPAVAGRRGSGGAGDATPATPAAAAAPPVSAQEFRDKLYQGVELQKFNKWGWPQKRTIVIENMEAGERLFWQKVGAGSGNRRDTESSLKVRSRVRGALRRALLRATVNHSRWESRVE
jgi:hypothetical protein